MPKYTYLETEGLPLLASVPLGISAPSAVACQMQPRPFEYSPTPFIVSLHHRRHRPPQARSFPVVVVVCGQLVRSPRPRWLQQMCSFPLPLFAVTRSSLLVSVGHCKLVPLPCRQRTRSFALVAVVCGNSLVPPQPLQTCLFRLVGELARSSSSSLATVNSPIFPRHRLCCPLGTLSHALYCLPLQHHC